MARHPADRQAWLQVRVPLGEQAYWDQMRRLQRFAPPEIERGAGVHIKTIRDLIKRLERGGYLRCIGWRGRAKEYALQCDQPDVPRLQRDGSPRPGAQGLGVEQMWRTMKMLRRFTWRELAVHASTDDVPVHGTSAKAYIRLLYRAGYLVMVDAARPPHKAAVYRLRPDRITGPLAPQVQRVKYIFDPNTGEVAGGEAEDG